MPKLLLVPRCSLLYIGDGNADQVWAESAEWVRVAGILALRYTRQHYSENEQSLYKVHFPSRFPVFDSSIDAISHASRSLRFGNAGMPVQRTPRRIM